MLNNSDQSAEQFPIEKATREDLPKILDFLISDFLVTEPLGVALSIKREEAADFFEGNFFGEARKEF